MRYYCVAIGVKTKLYIIYIANIMKNLFLSCFISPLNLKYKTKCYLGTLFIVLVNQCILWSGLNKKMFSKIRASVQYCLVVGGCM